MQSEEKNSTLKGWLQMTLGSLCKIETGKHDANHAKENGKYRFYTCAFEHLMCDTAQFSGECLILPGNGANVGEVFYYNGSFDAYQRTYVITDIKISPKYLYLHLLFKWKRINADKQFGSATNYIRMGNFTNYEVPIPPLAEQHRIVEKIEELFSALDKGREYLEKVLAQCALYRQAVLKSAFEGKLTGNNSTQYMRLGDLCHNVEYGTSSKSTETGKIVVLRMGNIQNGKLDWSDLVYTDNEEDIKKYKLNNNDVLFNRTNSPEWVGKTAIYTGEKPAIFAGYLIRINYMKDKVNPFYLNYFLNSQEAKNYGNTVKSFGVNQSNINGNKLKDYPFPYVDLLEQEKIVHEIEKRLSVNDHIEQSVRESLAQTEALRQSILKKAFEGSLVPQNPDDEPAAILLERIKAEREAEKQEQQKKKKKPTAL